MRQHNLAGNISCGKHVRQIGLAELVNNNRTAVEFQVIKGFETLQIRTPSDTHEDLVGFIISLFTISADNR